MEGSNGKAFARTLAKGGASRKGRRDVAMVVGLAFYWQFYRGANVKNVVADARGFPDGGLLPLAF